MSEQVFLHIITQLVLEYRASLATISRIFNMEELDMYNKLMSNKSRMIKDALIYVLNYEAENNITDQKKARIKILTFLTNLHRAKSQKEKLEIIKQLDNSEYIRNLKGKSSGELTDKEAFDIIKYRCKYALSRRLIMREFNISDRYCTKREQELDEETKKRIICLNEYNDYIKCRFRK